MKSPPSKKPNESSPFLIEGITLDKKIFRPSDWAERLCDALSEFKGRRICYSTLLRPVTYQGRSSVLVSHELKNQYPALFDEIMYFASSNQLKITENIDPSEI